MQTRSRTLRGRITWTVVLALALSLGAIATASAKDRNHDRIPDRWERSYDLSLKVNQAKRDQDRDDLVNREEYRAGTNPRQADSDSDGTDDASEGAGTITAWDPETGELTISLFGGDTVSGTVTEETKVQCAPVAEPDDPTEEPTDETKSARPGDQAAPPAPPADDPTSDDPSDDDPTAEDPPSDAPPYGGPHHGEGGCQQGVPCSADDLAVDEVVQEAHLSAKADGLVFDEIKLGRAAV
jgi:hypothetical protein